MNQVIFLDRDGTLNPDPGYISSIQDFQFFDDTIEALKKMSKEGFRFVIISNQSGISRGLIQKKDLNRINEFISRSFRENGINLLGIYYCPHHPDEKCSCRKPKSGMLHSAAKDHQIDLSGAYFIGDSYKDMKVGKSLGVKSILVRTGEGSKTEKQINEMGESVDYTGDSLMDCAFYILSQQEVK